MKKITIWPVTLAALCLLSAAPQQAPPEPGPGGPPAQPLAPQQLDDLVAPIALYPDPLVGEVLAASTYPMEIAEAEQWARDHPHWKPSKLVKEAKKQSWDPSVQGLVAFPQVLAMLSQDIGWTSSLGNAFLAQQADVMQAVQRMRVQAQARGKLHSTVQEEVTTSQNIGQSVINIQPVDPDMWYVPYYNPAYVWGPPVYGVYPPLVYPEIDIGFGWYPGFDIGLCFGGWGGWGWGGWGWMPDWYGGNILLNSSFFHRYGYGHFHELPYGRPVWSHDPYHRLGVPYGNREVAGRFAARGMGGQAGRGLGRSVFGAHQDSGRPRFGSSGFEQRSWTGRHSVFGGYHNGGMTRMQSDHGFSSMGGFHGFGGGGGRSFGGGGMRGGGRR